MNIIKASAAVIGAAAALALGFASSAHASTTADSLKYVALGDSYSSGAGAGSYTNSGCMRTNAAYPAVYAKSHDITDFTFVACGGATTSKVNSTQLKFLTADTDLVTITIGGNDIGFGKVMQTCTMSSAAACASAVTKAETTALTKLPAMLDTTYAGIKAKSPNAMVVVLGYPELYSNTAKACGFVAPASQTKLNEAGKVLNSVIEAEAAKFGFEYGDPTAAFTGHELCSKTPYLTGVNFAAINASYHPSPAGQADGYLDTMDAGVFALTSSR
jgi:lysophospholipase L1-like esterase